MRNTRKIRNLFKMFVIAFMVFGAFLLFSPKVFAETAASEVEYTPDKKVMYGRVYSRIGYTDSGASIYSSDDNSRAKEYVIAAIESAGISDCMSEYEKAEAVNCYLSEKLEYADYATTKDYFKEDYMPFTDYCLLTGDAVCSGYAESFQSMCCTLGIECWYVTGDVDVDGRSAYHAWNRVVVNGKSYYVDPCLSDSCGPVFSMSEELWDDRKVEAEHETFWLSAQRLPFPDSM